MEEEGKLFYFKYKLADSDENDRVKLEVYYKAMVNSLPSSPIEHPLVRVRMWLSEKLHERSSMFDNMEAAVSGTLRFAEAMGIRSGLNDAGRLATQLISAEFCGSTITCCCADVGGYE